MKKNFETYNPIICFLFYAFAIGFGMCLINPYYLAISVVFSLTLAALEKGIEAFKTLLRLLPIAVIIALINPLFGAYGVRVLGYVFGRPYTLEALIYGIEIALVFISAMEWFLSFNEVMKSDKLMYIFGGLIPSISLMLSMILRFIPNQKKKAREMNIARTGIGKGLNPSSEKSKIENGMTNLSALTSLALEGGVTTSMSMNARGYGMGRRTNFKIYKMKSKDIVLLSIMLLASGLVIFASIKGGTKYTYYSMEMAEGTFLWIGVIAYFVLLALPTFVNLWEDIRWHNLKSRI